MATNTEATCLYFVQNVERLPMEIDEDDIVHAVKKRKREMNIKVGIRCAMYVKRGLSELETEDIIEYSKPKRLRLTDEGKNKLRQLGEEHPLITQGTPSIKAKSAKKAAKLYKQGLLRTKAEMAADFKEQIRTLQDLLNAAEPAEQDMLDDYSETASDDTQIVTPGLRSTEGSFVFIPGDPENPLDNSSFRTVRTYPTPSNTSASPSSAVVSDDESFFSMTPLSFRPRSLTPDPSPAPEGAPPGNRKCPPDSSFPDVKEASVSLPPSPSPLPSSSPLPPSSPPPPLSPSSPGTVTGDSDETLVNASSSPMHGGASPAPSASADCADKIETLASALRTAVEAQATLSDALAKKEAALNDASARARLSASAGVRHLCRYVGSVFSLNRARAEAARLRVELECAAEDVRVLEEEIGDRAQYEDHMHEEHQRTVALMHEEIDALKEKQLRSQGEIADLQGQLIALTETYGDVLRERDDLKERLRVAEAQRVQAEQQAGFLQTRLDTLTAYVQSLFTGVFTTMNNHGAALIQNGIIPTDALSNVWPTQF